MQKLLKEEDITLQQFGHELVRDGKGIVTAFHFTEETDIEERKSIFKYKNVELSKPFITYYNRYDKFLYLVPKTSIGAKLFKKFGIKIENENFISDDETNYKLFQKFYNKFHNYDVDVFFKIKKELENNFVLVDLTVEITNYYCKKCGHRFDSYKSPFSSNKNMVDRVVLYNDDNKIALSVSYKEMAYKEKDKKLKAYYRSYKDKMVFKKDTEMFYLINNLSNTGSTYLCRKNPKTIKNISKYPNYRGTFFVEKFYSECFEYLSNKYSKEIEYIHKDLITMIEDKNNDFVIVMTKDLNRIKHGKYDPQILMYIYRILMIKVKYNVKNTALALLLSYLKSIRPDLLKKMKNLNDKEILNLLGVNNKDVIEILSYCGYNQYSYYLFSIGLIKDKNIYRSLFRKSYELYNVGLELSDIKRFFRQYKKNNSDKSFVKKMLGCSDYFLNDTINMYTKIRKLKPDYEIDMSDKILTLHDYLSEDYNKLKTKNKKIAKNKFLSDVFKNSNCNGIEYRLAKETHELITTGTKMCICVGSYGEKAVKKHCFIVIGYKDDEPVTCMEFIKRENDFKCIQIKKSRNYLAKREEQEYLVDLFEKNDISYKTCSDINIFEEEGIDYVGTYF